MKRSPLVVGLAAVFVGLTTLLVVVAVVTGSLVTLVVALPLGVTAAIMWYHATGRLAERTRRRAREATRTASARGDGGPTAASGGRVRGPGAPGGTADGTRTGRSSERGPEPGWYVDAHGQRWFVGPRGNRWRMSPDGKTVGSGRPGETVGPGGPSGTVGPGGASGAGGPATAPAAGLTRREALSRLGLDAGADDAAIRAAYREKVKEHHPDAEGGDEEQFKRVAEAYEVLTER